MNSALRSLSLAVILAVAAPCAPVMASDDDHEAARAALQRGEILPLPRILEIVAEQAPGDVIEVELDDNHGVLEYEVKVLAADGRVREVKMNARTGVVREIEDD